MRDLKQAIDTRSIVKTADMLDVSQFLNGIVDVDLMEKIGEDFARQYADTDFDLFVTVESSGIAPAVFASRAANKPLVIIKKQDKALDPEIFLQQESVSYTKQKKYFLSVKKMFVAGQRVVLIDDFLPQGSVVLNVKKMLESVGGRLVATGICIAKAYQPGYEVLKSMGHDVYCQVAIDKLDPDTQTIYYR